VRTWPKATKTSGAIASSISCGVHFLSTKVAVEAALGLRSKVDIYGVDYPTRDDTWIRDYIHVSGLVRAHSGALQYLHAGGASLFLVSISRLRLHRVA
jgi:UDP-glucose 4-epimerase